MRLVSAAKYAELQYRYERMAESRDTAVKLAEERLSTITELSARLDGMQASHIADTKELHDLRRREVTS